MAKYDPLRDHLADRTGQTVILSFSEIEDLVGDLPASASTPSFWSNNSKGQAQAWRAAGWHVDAPHLDARRVLFARGERGGTLAARKANGTHTVEPRTSAAPPDASLRICPTCHTAMPVSRICDYC
jgi:hypothetical protein